MFKSRSPGRVPLKDAQLLCVHDAWLSVVRGRVWVTCGGDPDDHFLDSGQAMRVPPGARAFVGAEGDAEVELVPAPGRLDAARRLAAQCLSFFIARRSWT